MYFSRKEYPIDALEALELHHSTKLTRATLDAFRRRAAEYNSLDSDEQISIRGETIERYLNGATKVYSSSVSSACNVSLGDALDARRSTKVFGGFDFAKKDLVIDALRSALGTKTDTWTDDRPEGARAYPSAGALYSVEHYVIQQDERGKFTSSYFSPYLGNIAGHRVQIDQQELALSVILPSTVLRDCQALVVQIANLENPLKKYGSRGYRFVSLEAGMAAQSIMLCSQAHGFGSCCWGGFVDDTVLELMNLRDHPTIVLNILTIGVDGKFGAQEL
jgi:SagB-type dehydrogenase family enzyme